MYVRLDRLGAHSLDRRLSYSLVFCHGYPPRLRQMRPETDSLGDFSISPRVRTRFASILSIRYCTNVKKKIKKCELFILYLRYLKNSYFPSTSTPRLRKSHTENVILIRIFPANLHLHVYKING